MNMARTVLATFFLATIWMVSAILARSSDAVFLPQAFRFLSGALVLGVAPLIFWRRPPGLSIRLLHAAVTVGGLSYFIAPVFTFYALRVVPSGLVAVLYLSVPLWFLLLAYHGQEATLADFAMAGIGIVVFCGAIVPVSYVRGPAHLPLLCLFVGTFAFMCGGWVARRLFWLHSGLDLGFWSMLFAGIAHLLMGVIVGEHHEMQHWDRAYWGYLLYLGIFVTGLAAFIGTGRKNFTGALAETVIAPILALGLGIALWRETPLDPFVIGATVLVAYPVIRNLNITPLGRWMALTLYNEKRQGDRLVCQLDAEIGTQRSRIVDIALDGVGFRSDHQFKDGETVPLKFPIGRDGGHVFVECRIAHCQAGGKGYAYVGGLEFVRTTVEHRQSLVEFLARLARAEDR